MMVKRYTASEAIELQSLNTKLETLSPLASTIPELTVDPSKIDELLYALINLDMSSIALSMQTSIRNILSTAIANLNNQINGLGIEYDE